MIGKIVVVNENILGVIPNESPSILQIIMASALRGSNERAIVINIKPKDNVRLASKQDFIDFHVSFKYFDNRTQYEYN